jgi:hypothetical protein
MSRSNPHESAPNPATRWFEWTGELGVVRYYDKVAAKTVDLPLPFTFLLLDELSSVRGWHDASDSGIYSNEVKDTRQDLLIVKSFKGGTIAEGLYRDIKDRVNSAGGKFTMNCYIAFKNGGEQLAIGSLRFKGAALHAWSDFRKNHRADIYKKAVQIVGYTEGKKGRITFRVPTMKLVDISVQTDVAAVALDSQFQEWLAGYLKRKKSDQVDPPVDHDEDASDGDSASGDWTRDAAPDTDDETGW